MKKALALVAVLVMSLAMLAGCASQQSDVHEVATNEFDFAEFGGPVMHVSVDISDGWNVEFGQNATYVYNGNNDGELEPVAFGTYADQEEFDAFVAENQGAQGFEQTNYGVHCVGEGQTDFFVLMNPDKGAYYRVTVTPDADADEVFGRFGVESE